MSLLKENRFKLELGALFLGLINVILVATVYKPHIKDEYYLSVVCTVFIISLHYVVLQMCGCIQNSWNNVIFFEVVFHLLAALCLIGNSVQFLMATIHIVKCGVDCADTFYLARRFGALFLGFSTGIFYAAGGFILCEARGGSRMSYSYGHYGVGICGIHCDA